MRANLYDETKLILQKPPEDCKLLDLTKPMITDERLEIIKHGFWLTDKNSKKIIPNFFIPLNNL